MDSILTLLPFKERRAPLVDKVKRDSELMYQHSRYVIVLDEQGHVAEQHFNRRFDDDTVDCLTVFAPVTYRGVYIEKAVVLEIGFRRFVPYAQTEYRLNSSTRRGPSHRVKKGQQRITKEKNTDKKIAIKPRVPIATLTDDATFDLMPVITMGMQKCVDSFVQAWTHSEVVQVRGVWQRYEYEASIFVRIPKHCMLLCATASFSELAWRSLPGKQLHSIARGIKKSLRDFMKLHKRPSNGYSDDTVKKSGTLFWGVADKLISGISYKAYSSEMVEKLLELIGTEKSPERKLISQIWKVFNISKIAKDPSLKWYEAVYGEMKQELLLGWKVKNYRSLRHENKKRKLAQLRKRENKPYHSHAANSVTFSVFASKKILEQMMRAYDARKSNPHQSDEDDDIPF